MKFNYLIENYSALEGLLNIDLEEFIESCSSVLDDLWRIETKAYQQSRMEKLIEMIGNQIAVHVQKKLEVLDIWNEEYEHIKELLNSVITQNKFFIHL